MLTRYSYSGRLCRTRIRCTWATTRCTPRLRHWRAAKSASPNSVAGCRRRGTGAPDPARYQCSDELSPLSNAGCLTSSPRSSCERRTIHPWKIGVDDWSSSLKAWLTFAGIVLVIGVLNWGQAVLVPVALAAVLSFVLARPVTWLERRLGRVLSVLLVVTLVFVVLGLAGWGLVRQLDGLADDLPSYRRNITAKVADIRGVSKGGTVEKLQSTIENIRTDIVKLDPPARSNRAPVVMQADPPAQPYALGWVTPLLGPL